MSAWAGWLLFAGVLVLTWPNTLGGQTGYVVVSGHSMEPTYYTGDLVVTRTTTSVRVGQVVVYDVPKGGLGSGMAVVHRVVGGTLSRGLTTKGDNNPSSDIWHPVARDVRGVVVVHLPSAGRVLLLLRSPLTLALAGGVTVAWILWPREDEDVKVPEIVPTSP